MASDDFDYMRCTTRKEFNPASLTTSYQPLNSPGFDHSAKIMKLYNGSSTVSIDISLDGVTSHDFIPPLGTLIVDFQANHSTGPQWGHGTLVVRAGQILWGKILTNATYLQMVGYY